MLMLKIMNKGWWSGGYQELKECLKEKRLVAILMKNLLEVIFFLPLNLVLLFNVGRYKKMLPNNKSLLKLL